MVVLVVDDEPDLRFIVTLFLARSGEQTVEASDGVAALAVCEQVAERLTLVLTDENMPRMGGSELRSTLARTHPDLPVVVWSCLPDPSRDVVRKDPAGVLALLHRAGLVSA